MVAINHNGQVYLVGTTICHLDMSAENHGACQRQGRAASRDHLPHALQSLNSVSCL